MGFIVFRGLAQREDDQHGYVCMAATEDLETALQRAHERLKEAGYTIATVDEDPLIVPSWRAWLPGQQGRWMRESWCCGVSVVVSAEPHGK